MRVKIRQRMYFSAGKAVFFSNGGGCGKTSVVILRWTEPAEAQRLTAVTIAKRLHSSGPRGHLYAEVRYILQAWFPS